MHVYFADSDTVYFILLTALSENCEDTASKQVLVQPPLSIGESLISSKEIRTYYDNSGSQIKIEVSGKGGILESLIIFDQLGRIVQKNMLNEYVYANSIRAISFENNESGSIYFVAVQFEGKGYIQKLFIP